jgi:hypothetical protein
MPQGRNTCTNYGTGWHRGVIFHHLSKKLRYPRKTENPQTWDPHHWRQGGTNGSQRLLRTEVREDIQSTFLWLPTRQKCPSGIGIGTENCRKTDWVIDLDIKGFFDNIDHDKLMLALEKHVKEKWCILYIKRWLQMPSADEIGRTDSEARQRHTTGRSDKPTACQLVSTLRHGQMVGTNPSYSKICALCR